MITYFVAFLLSLMVGAVLTLAVRNRAHHYGWLDQATSSRNVHKKSIPRLGGVAIVVGTLAPLTALLVYDSGVGRIFRSEASLVLGLFSGGLTIALLGLYDDLHGANARMKFGVQVVVALGLYALGFRVTAIANPFAGPGALELGLASLPFTVLWMVGVVNAMNLIDGLDGLAGGVAFFGVATNFILAIARGDILMCVVMAALGGAILGFLIFNFNPASIFMGDTGSMFLGFVLAATSLKVNSKSGTAVAMVVPVIALGLPIMDTLLAMARRAMLGRSMFSADKEHIHHRLMSRLVLTHRGAVLALYALCCLFGLTALGLSYANSAQSAMLLLAVSLVVFVLMRKLGYLNPQMAAQVGQVRRRNIHLRTLMKDLSERLTLARTVSEMWDGLRPLVHVLEGARLELRLERQGPERQDALTLQTERNNAGSAFPLGARVEIRSGDASHGFLTVTWKDGRDEVNRDEELALELVADAVAQNLTRLTAIREQVRTPANVIALRK